MKEKVYLSASKQTKDWIMKKKALQNRIIFVDDLNDADYLLLETDGKIKLPSEQFSDLFRAKSSGLKVRILKRENIIRLENEMEKKEKIHKNTQKNLEASLE